MRAKAAGIEEGVGACRGKVLGVVGYGDIGQEAANLARAFKMRIIALRRRKELSQHDKDLNLKVSSLLVRNITE